MVVHDGPAFEHAYALLFAAPILGGLATSLVGATGSKRARLRLAAGAALAAALGSAAGWHLFTPISTPSQEGSFALQWRGSLPPGSQVTYLERSGSMLSMLPLYGDLGPGGLVPRPLATGEPLPDSNATLQSGYWYHGSICSTATGAPDCEAIEQALILELIATRTLVASASRPDHRYNTAAIPVGLYRVVAVR